MDITQVHNSDAILVVNNNYEINDYTKSLIKAANNTGKDVYYLNYDESEKDYDYSKYRL